MWQDLDNRQKLAVYIVAGVLLLFAVWLSYTLGGVVT